MHISSLSLRELVNQSLSSEDLTVRRLAEFADASLLYMKDTEDPEAFHESISKSMRELTSEAEEALWEAESAQRDVKDMTDRLNSILYDRYLGESPSQLMTVKAEALKYHELLIDERKLTQNLVKEVIGLKEKLDICFILKN